MFKILLKKSASKAIKQFPSHIQKSIAKALDSLRQLGTRAHDTKKLNEPLGGYRMRIGDYRILFDKNDEIILIHKISKRADSYR